MNTRPTRSPESEVRDLAYRHRNRLHRLFWLPLLASLFLAWLGAWAEHQDGWEAQAFSIALFCASALLFMFSVFTGVLLYQWHKESSRAFEMASKYREDPEWFRAVFKGVIGPIPW